MTWRRSAALPLALTLCLPFAACGSADRAGGAGETIPATPLAGSSAPATGPARSPAEPAGKLTVQVTKPTALRATPGGRVVGRLAPRTEFRSATIVPVVRRRGDWLGVISTALPNGRIGWIPAGARLVAYRTRYSIRVSLRHRAVAVRDAGRVVLRFPVAVGGPSTPTPTGTFAVTDKLFTGDPSSPYGCCILALSARQPHTPQGWGGGDRIAIHATNLPASIGTAASLGCLRAPEADVRRLVRVVPLGTLVTIGA